jgi:hypothetical protein
VSTTIIQGYQEENHEFLFNRILTFSAFSASSAVNYYNKERTMITVNPIDSTTFEVVVEAGTTTTHQVSVKASYYEKLTDKRVAPEVLVEKSFEFLLDRESNTSILRSFDLPVIGQYFPEYERVIKGMLV